MKKDSKKKQKKSKKFISTKSNFKAGRMTGSAYYND